MAKVSAFGIPENKELIFDCSHQVIFDDCLIALSNLKDNFDLTFLDPPFNQKKEYASYDDNLPEEEYWQNLTETCKQIFKLTKDGGALYFMQREKNAENVLRVLRETGWTLQNLIVWKKMTSAVPSTLRFGKSFQIIAFATKGKRPKTFNRLRIDPPLLKHQKKKRENGVFVTDVWDNIRELTSGYFAGNEPIRNETGERFHKQQSPIALLLRIILSSSKIGDFILDPFAGTGTCAVAAKQLKRSSVNIDIDKENIKKIESRLNSICKADLIDKYFEDYKFTENLANIWEIDLNSLTVSA